MDQLFTEECHCTHCGHHFSRTIKQSTPPHGVQWVPSCYICMPGSAKRNNPYGATPVKPETPFFADNWQYFEQGCRCLTCGHEFVRIVSTETQPTETHKVYCCSNCVNDGWKPSR